MDIIQSKYGYFIGHEQPNGVIHAPMNPAGRKLTGCHTVFGTADYCGSSPNVTTYRTLEQAKAALRKINGDE